MAVSYTNILSADLIVSDIAALVEWRDAVVRQAWFSDARATSPLASPDSTLLSWCRQEKDRQAIDAKIVERLEKAFSDLIRSGQDLTARPDLTCYDLFCQQFESYLDHVQRLHQDLADSAGAVDSLTGLRTVAGLRAELKREQDRYDRKGASFSIASIEIDDLDRLRQSYDRRAMDAVYAHVAKVIAGAIRSFDDAYYMGSGEYLVILKHVEFLDACAALDRLCTQIGRSPVVLPGGGSAPVTVSCGIAEAQQKEQPEGILVEAKAARQQASAAGGNRVQERRERSALESYVQDQGRGF